MKLPDNYDFFNWSPHDTKHVLFGTRIIEPNDPDPYTREELDKMKEDLVGASVEDFIYSPNKIIPARYPLQELINLIKNEGGECFWHEGKSLQEIELYFGEEMLEEMRQSGLRYIARIRPCRVIEDCYRDCEEFLITKAASYQTSKEYLEEQIFEYEECHPFYLYSKEARERAPDMINCTPGSLGGPRLQASIIFSSIPIAVGRYQLLKPILGELIKIDKWKKRAADQNHQKQKEQRKKDRQLINSMEAYMRAKGATEEQINQMFHSKRSVTGFRR